MAQTKFSATELLTKSWLYERNGIIFSDALIQQWPLVPECLHAFMPKLPSDNKRIANCILTQHYWTPESEIFKKEIKRYEDIANNRVVISYRDICLHCGSYRIHKETVEFTENNERLAFPNKEPPIEHRGPDKRMYHYWEVQAMKKAVEEHNRRIKDEMIHRRVTIPSISIPKSEFDWALFDEHEEEDK